MTTRDKQLSPEQFKEINQLYWDEGLYQDEIADMFGVDQSHISRIVRGIARGYHGMLATKLHRLNQNIIPKSNEPTQARVLRARREKLQCTKLSWGKVCKIRKLYFSGKKAQWQLARMYGLNQSTISKLIQGENWKVNA